MKTYVLIFALFILWPAAASAQRIALIGGTVYLPEGPVEGVVVAIDDGVISRVEAASQAPEGYEVFDVSGKVVTAGLIAAPSEIGLSEVSMEADSVDTDPDLEGDDIHAELVVAEAYNPRSTVVPLGRSHGVTSAVIFPEGGLVSGQGGWVQLTGKSQSEAVLNPSVGMLATVEGGKGSRALTLHRLRQLLSETEAWSARRAQWETGDSRAYSASASDMEALQLVLRGDIPLVVRADRAADIEAVLRLTEGSAIKLVFVGGAEAHLVAPQLARREAYVLVDAMVYGPGSFDQLQARPDNAALLHAAGVKVLIGGLQGGDSHRPGRVRQQAGNAVRGGLAHTVAVKAVTENMALAFGLEGAGRIEVGARADVVVWSGDPLELSTQVEAVWIGGAAMSLQTRQARLLERYRLSPEERAQPLPLP